MTGGDGGSPVLELRDLTKVYRNGSRRVEAVAGVSLTVRRGEVYGFLGPNGAGKSTTIRMALGLIRPTSGRVLLFGEEAGSRAVRCRLGSLVDGGAFYPFLSGRANLRVLARTQGHDGARIDSLLERVGLCGDAGRKVKGYSLGMRQRLGVAASLLDDPELVILDEPANGLDAAGIQDMRELVRSLANDGKAVFLSSHLLHEVQQVCDRVAIVSRGRLLREAPIEQLLGSDDAVELVADPAERAIELLAGRFAIDRDGPRLRLRAPKSAIPGIVRELVQADVDVLQISPEAQNLEEVFLAMTKE